MNGFSFCLYMTVSGFDFLYCLASNLFDRKYTFGVQQKWKWKSVNDYYINAHTVFLNHIFMF